MAAGSGGDRGTYSRIRRRRVEGLVSANPTTLAELGLGSKFATLRAIRARNWASSAKAAAGVDVLTQVEITDKNGDVVYKDAADRDYATAEVTLHPVLDDTATGLGITGVDATGAARAAGEASAIIMEGPVTVKILNGTTATDFMTVDLIVES